MNAVFLILFQVYFSTSDGSRSPSWVWTNWIKCKDTLDCEYEARRYCAGAGKRKKVYCGRPRNKQNLYYRAITGCSGIPTECKEWATVTNTTCQDQACDYIKRKRCKSKPDCTVTYHYTCNPHYFVDCTGEWTKWEFASQCQLTADGKTSTRSLQRSCIYNNKPSVLCGGNTQKKTEQTKSRLCSHNEPNFNDTAFLTATNNTGVMTTKTKNKATMIALVTLGILLIPIVYIAYMLAKRIMKPKSVESVTGATVNFHLGNEEDNEYEQNKTVFVEHSDELPINYQKSNDVASADEKEQNYHIYEELTTNPDYENTNRISNTDDPRDSSDLKRNITHEIKTIEKNKLEAHEYITVEEVSERPLLLEANGYSIPVQSCSQNKMPTNKYGYMQLDAFKK